MILIIINEIIINIINVQVILIIITQVRKGKASERIANAQPDSKAIPKCQPNSEREKKNRSGLIPRALGPTKTSLNCLK